MMRRHRGSAKPDVPKVFAGSAIHQRRSRSDHSPAISRCHTRGLDPFSRTLLRAANPIVDACDARIDVVIVALFRFQFDGGAIGEHLGRTAHDDRRREAG